MTADQLVAQINAVLNSEDGPTPDHFTIAAPDIDLQEAIRIARQAEETISWGCMVTYVPEVFKFSVWSPFTH